MLVDPNEVLRPDNNGLQNIVSLLKPLPVQFNVSPGDVLHVSSHFDIRRVGPASGKARYLKYRK
jgi:hypothetical protein